jgi:NAD(P)-dependent dehydrogenase (short-subunit alcohol dehydrogenase family)
LCTEIRADVALHRRKVAVNLQLKGKSALITGSTAGIGLDIARNLYLEGAIVFINGRTEARVSEARERILDSSAERDSARVQGIPLDLSTPNGQESLFHQLPQVDILVNNLGIYKAKPFSEIPRNDWGRLFDINVVSGAVLSQYYLKGMKEKNWGRILFIASESGGNIPPEMIHYGVSKAAQIALARGISELTKGTNITVNSVLPGPTHSEGVSKFLKEVVGGHQGDRIQRENDFLKHLRPTSLIQRFATGDEVATLVTYLASPLASATNGASVRVEGGILRSPY